MLFNSYIFIFVFLPLVLFVWFGLNRLGKYGLAQAALLGMSLWFYGYFNYSYIGIILISIFGNWAASKGIELFGKKNIAIKKAVGILGIVFNLGLLGYFKYYDFFMENINFIFGADWTIMNILLPLGISFFTFQQLSFMADRMKGTAPHYNLIDYMTFVAYFPQLIAGPIVCHRDLIPQFHDMEKRKADLSNILFGSRLFLIGLGKKVLLADELGKIVNAGYADVSALDSLGALFVSLAYTFQMFLDFSGYCDMAMGIGCMMNINLPLNFNSPYKSCSIREFWSRWHMTLNAFFTEYVYIPLGGSRCTKWKKIRNIMTVFLLSGFWHGANWTFVIWGILHGLMVSIESVVHMGAIPKKIRWFFTFAFVNLTFIIFRSDTLAMAVQFYRQLFSFTDTGRIWSLAGSLSGFKSYIFYLIAEHFGGYEGARMMSMLLMAALFLCVIYICTKPNSLCWVQEKTAGRLEMWFLAFVFSLSVLSFSGVAVFLYFNF